MIRPLCVSVLLLAPAAHAGVGDPCEAPPIDRDCSGCGDYAPWADTCWTVPTTVQFGKVYNLHQSLSFESCEEVCRGIKTMDCRLTHETGIGLTAGTTGVLTALIDLHKKKTVLCGLRLQFGCPYPPRSADPCDCECAHSLTGEGEEEEYPLEIFCYETYNYVQGFEVRKRITDYGSNCRIVRKPGILPASSYLECECDKVVEIAQPCEPCEAQGSEEAPDGEFYIEYGLCGMIKWRRLNDSEKFSPPKKPVDGVCDSMYLPPWSPPTLGGVGGPL